jgi:cyclopropane fatty-acyl-phospholipid synthase-like methyltransferase
MDDRTVRHEKAQSFFDSLWMRGDPWELESSEFERVKYDREIQILTHKHYRRVLEMGCGAGAFTRRLAPLADQVLALDISSAAISRARGTGMSPDRVEFRVQNIMDFNPRKEGPWDLIVLNETICYLGWLYTFFEVTWFATELFNATRPGGQVLMANTSGGVDDHLITPPIIRTYHDLFINVGYKRAAEEVFTGSKHNVQLEVIISLYARSAEN